MGRRGAEQLALQSQQESLGSEAGSVCEHPPLDDTASALYNSLGDTDSLGSVGAMVGDPDTHWGTLEGEGLFDYLGVGPNDPGRSSLCLFLRICERFEL